MHRRSSAPPAALAVAAMAFALSFTACATQDDDAASGGTWIGTITTEGNVTTVINESGSVWGGTARLVEEASIGVEQGADEYMFGRVGGMYLTDDRVYVIDPQVLAVRAYDYDGAFIRAYGGEGQGPGEYTRPSAVAADASGQVYVLDSRLDRVNVYAPTGEPVDTWSLETGSCCLPLLFPLADGTVWKFTMEPLPEPGNLHRGAQVVGPTGSQAVVWAPDIEYQRSTYETPAGYRVDAPFGALRPVIPAPGGKLVFGATDRYRFEVLSPDGSRLVVERYWDPVPVPPEHKEWERRRTIALFPGADPAGFHLDTSQIPDYKPAYRWFMPAQSGEIWLHRSGASEQLSDCAGDPLEVGLEAEMADPCWRDRAIIDAFDGDGRYLGDVEVPEEIAPYVGSLRIRGRVVAGIAQDDAGTYMVKRYRLVLPGEERN